MRKMRDDLQILYFTQSNTKSLTGVVARFCRYAPRTSDERNDIVIIRVSGPTS